MEVGEKVVEAEFIRYQVTLNQGWAYSVGDMALVRSHISHWQAGWRKMLCTLSAGQINTPWWFPWLLRYRRTFKYWSLKSQCLTERVGCRGWVGLRKLDFVGSLPWNTGPGVGRRGSYQSQQIEGQEWRKESLFLSAETISDYKSSIHAKLA